MEGRVRLMQCSQGGERILRRKGGKQRYNVAGKDGRDVKQTISVLRVTWEIAVSGS